MIGIALFVFGILASVAALHVIWAFGKSWPTQDRKALARTVIGVQSEQMPPAGVTLVVAGLIFAVGCLPWVWLGVLPSAQAATSDQALASATALRSL